MEPVAGIEIGTTKVTAMVGEMREDGPIMITGLGSVKSAGVRKGEIIDFENVIACVKSALEKAESTSNVNLGAVYISVSGGKVRSGVNSGAIPVQSPDGVVTEDDVDEVCDIARAMALPDDRRVIHTIPLRYKLDDLENIVNPDGMVGRKLGLEMLVMHSSIGQLKNVERVVEELQLEVVEVAFGGLCSALAVLTPDQKKMGVVVIDLGGGTTDYMAYVDGVPVCGGSLGVGGDHVTNDIAAAFSISINSAEKIKCERGGAIIDDDPLPAQVDVPGELGFERRSVGVRALQVVISLRMRETFEIVRDRVEEAGGLQMAGAGVILTGGGARLKGVEKLAGEVFGLSCSIGVPREISGIARETGGYENATCCGLVKYGFRHQSQLEDERDDSFLGSFVKRLFGAG